MQEKVYKFVENQVKNKNIFINKVLDIGSLDINGCLRPLFSAYNYIGLDKTAGKNVDVVANSHSIPFSDNSFDVVCAVEMLEHDDNPFLTMDEIYRVLKPNGWCIITASGISFGYHNPPDYWRFTADGFGVLLKKFRNTDIFSDTNEVYGVGQK